MKQIGPTFFAELTAAGITDFRFSWSAAGTIDFDPAMDAGAVAAVEAVYAAHDPTATVAAPVAPIDARKWLERLSPAKQLAIATAGIANPALMLWLLKAAGAQTGVILSDPDTTAGLAALVAAGVITTADQATLLAP